MDPPTGQRCSRTTPAFRTDPAKGPTAINAHIPVDRHIYSDDSGDAKTGLRFYSALSVPIGREADFAREWNALRSLWEQWHGVPTDYELHSYKFLTGRGRPGGRNPSRAERRRMARGALDLIGAFPGLVVTSVYSVGTDIRAAERAAFAGLVRDLDGRLVADHESAELIVDGDGTDRLYEEVYGEIRPVSIVGPPLQLPAHRSIWLQAADLVAYCAFQSVVRHETRVHLWDWYERYLPKAAPPREA
ncbi:DUF3800 domain-containing protein [Streptomyces sp. NPDC048659]|uniref:DUF3800 domain-containing protein n=1 Tax=Streptomyces sp. NPDC048659 TaxID=3155489 RepID=UPI00341C3D96